MSTIIRRDTRLFPKSLKLSYAACAIIASAGFATPTVAASVPFGPTAYLQASDSPFNAFSFSYSYLENFEDHLLNTPGVSGTTPGAGVASVVFGPSIHDSVDADDGAIDGSGLKGDSYFSQGGSVGFTFSAATLGALPTHVGIVWTDGGAFAPITFQAFDASNNLIGTITGNNADGSNNGETAEDRFFGYSNDTGILRILISNSSGGIEVDHLQYGLAAVGVGETPLPSTVMLFASGLGVLGLVVRRRRKTSAVANT